MRKKRPTSCGRTSGNGRKGRANHLARRRSYDQWRKKEETEEKKHGWRYSERRFGSFRRAFRLPEDVDAAKIEAAFKKGVLTITLPKITSRKNRKEDRDQDTLSQSLRPAFRPLRERAVTLLAMAGG